MNIFTIITIRFLKKDKLRTFMTIVGVTLSVAMISGVLAFATSFQYFMVQHDKRMNGDWYASVYSPTETQLRNARGDKRTEEIGTYREIGYIRAAGLKNHYKPYIQIVEMDDTLESMAGVELIEGRMPENSSELVLPSKIATEGGLPLKVGGKIQSNLGYRVAQQGGHLPAGSRLNAATPYEENEEFHILGRREYTVVGISKDISIKSYNSPGYMAMSAAEPGGESYGDGDENLVAYIKTKKHDNITPYMEEIFPRGQVEFNVNLLTYLGASHFGYFSMVLSSVSGILILLIMIGSAALIYNTFSITVAEWIKEYGLLASIGATRKQLRNSLVTESLLISTVGIPLGMLMGIGGIWMALKIMGRFAVRITGGEADFALHLHIPILFLTVILSLATVLISVAIPAKRASKIVIIDAIHQKKYSSVEHYTLKVPKFIQRRLGFEANLSSKYFSRSGRKYRTVIISLTLSITLFLSVNFVGSYFIDGEGYSSKSDPSYNVEYMQKGTSGTPAEGEAQKKILRKLSAAPGITYKRIIEYAMLYGDAGEEGEKVPVAIMSQQDYMTYLLSIGLIGKQPSVVLLGDINLDKGDINLYSRDQESYVVDKDDIAFQGIGDKALPPGANHYEFSGMLVISKEAASNIFGDYDGLVTDRGGFFKCKDPAKTYAAMEKICREEGYATNNLTNVAGEARDARNLAIMINVFAYSFVILISLIAVVNVFGTISNNIIKRRREFAVLRAVGMKDSELYKMVGYESLIYGGRSLVLSLGISLIISILLYSFIWLGEGLNYLVPWRALILSIAIVSVVVFATMTYAVAAVSRGNLMDALKNENL